MHDQFIFCLSHVTKQWMAAQLTACPPSVGSMPWLWVFSMPKGSGGILGTQNRGSWAAVLAKATPQWAHIGITFIFWTSKIMSWSDTSHHHFLRTFFEVWKNIVFLLTWFWLYVVRNKYDYITPSLLLSAV